MGNGEWYSEKTEYLDSGHEQTIVTSSLGDNWSQIDTRISNNTVITDGDMFILGQLYTDMYVVSISGSLSGVAVDNTGAPVIVSSGTFNEILYKETSAGISSFMLLEDEAEEFLISIQEQQGIYGTIALDENSNWIYTLDNTNPNTIALSSDQTAF